VHFSECARRRRSAHIRGNDEFFEVLVSSLSVINERRLSSCRREKPTAVTTVRTRRNETTTRDRIPGWGFGKPQRRLAPYRTREKHTRRRANRNLRPARLTLIIITFLFFFSSNVNTSLFGPVRNEMSVVPLRVVVVTSSLRHPAHVLVNVRRSDVRRARRTGFSV